MWTIQGPTTHTHTRYALSVTKGTVITWTIQGPTAHTYAHSMQEGAVA